MRYCLPAVLCLPLLGHAQLPGRQIHEWQSGIFQSNFGRAVAILGDVNGDGFADVLVGAYRDTTHGTDAGRAFVFSGKDARLLHVLDGGKAAFARFGAAVAAAGDVDGDAKPDAIIGAWGERSGTSTRVGAAYVYSFAAATPRILWTFRGSARDDTFGESVQAAGDVTGDGRADLLVGAPQAPKQGLGYADVYDGNTGARIARIPGNGGNRSGFGFGLASLDVDKDGKTDLVAVGAPAQSAGKNQNAGAVHVYRVPLYRNPIVLPGAAANDFLGWSLASAGDVNADGSRDLIAGAPGCLTCPGTAVLYSGTNLAVLRTLTGRSTSLGYGWSVAGAGDVDDDGRDDVVVGAISNITAGYVRVTGGVTFTTLLESDGAKAGDNYGVAVAGGGDVDGDERPDVVVGANNAVNLSGQRNGSAHVLAGHLLTLLPRNALNRDVRCIFANTGGQQPLLLNAGPGQSGRPWVLLGSLAGASPPLRVPGYPDVPLVIDPYFVLVLSIPIAGVLDNQGKATTNLQFPPVPALAGRRAHHAFIVFDPGRNAFVMASNAAALLFQ